MRARHRLGLLLLLGPLASCAVSANLSADEILSEVDAIVRIEGTGRDLRLRYAERAQVSLWYTRLPWLWPLQPPLRWVFGRTGEGKIEKPAAHVRELLLELPDEVGGDLLVGAKAAVRLGWIAQLETNSQSRLVAIDGLTRLALELGVDTFAGDFATFGAPPAAEQLLAARAGVQAGRPEVRPAGQDEKALGPYVEALAGLTKAPLEDGIARLTLLEDVAMLYAAEPMAALRPAIADALRSSIRHVVEGLLVEVVQGRATEYVDLRLCAMEQIRRLGGPRVVPLLLALMASSPQQKARGESWYDPDPLVVLRLIKYCGQLRGELAETAVQLPGRQGFEVRAPVDFLAITILNEQAYYSKLRTPAIAALTWSLQRPRLDTDPKWVQEWRNQRR